MTTTVVETKEEKTNTKGLNREWLIKKEWMPHVIILITGSQKTRFDEYFKQISIQAQNSQDLNFKYIDIKYPQYLFLRSSNPCQLILNLWKNEILNKFIHCSFIIKYATNDLNFILSHRDLKSNTNEKIIRIVSDPKLTNIIGPLIPLDVNLSPSKYTHVLYLIKAYQRYYFAVCPKSHYFASFATEIKERLKLHSEHTINRAYYKLREIFLRCGYSFINTNVLLNSSPSSMSSITNENEYHFGKIVNCLNVENDGYFQSLMQGFCALDIGSSPGGWTKFLLDIGAKHVISVDPGQMKLNEQCMKRVIHFKCVIDKCMNQLPMYAPFDIIVCDINMEPEIAVQMIFDIAQQYLIDGGCIIFTLKLQSRNCCKRENAIQYCKKILQPLFSEIRIVWLFANKAKERTLIATKTKLTDVEIEINRIFIALSHHATRAKC